MIPVVNLLPWREIRQKEHQKRYWRLVSLTLLLAAGCQYFAGLYLNSQIGYQEARASDQQRSFKQLQDKQNEIKKLKETLQTLDKKSDLIFRLKDETNTTTRLMNQLAATVPEKVTLESLNVRGLQVELEGSSQGTEPLTQMLRGLEESGLFSKVKTDSILIEEEEPLNLSQKFRLSLLLNITVDEGEVYSLPGEVNKDEGY